jgi:hypothetical protein
MHCTLCLASGPGSVFALPIGFEVFPALGQRVDRLAAAEESVPSVFMDWPSLATLWAMQWLCARRWMADVHDRELLSNAGSALPGMPPCPLAFVACGCVLMGNREVAKKCHIVAPIVASASSLRIVVLTVKCQGPHGCRHTVLGGCRMYAQIPLPLYAATCALPGCGISIYMALVHRTTQLCYCGLVAVPGGTP